MEPLSLSDNVLKVLLVCGILSALVIAGTDVLGGVKKSDYNFGSQSASVLTAAGSETRRFVVPLDLAGFILLAAFSIGVWFAADRNWALRVVAILLAGNAVFSALGITFFPLHLNEAVNSPTNRVNTIVMATGVFLLIFAIGFAAVGNHNWFRFFSIGILLLFFVLTILGIWFFPHLTSAQPVSRIGLQERTMIYSEMLWLALQAVVLLKA